jgi:hypothetical protein
MARVFTTKFTFNQQSYDAIVVLISSQGELNFTVKLMDDELFELLPKGLNYTGKDGFKSVESENFLAKSLIQSIAHSIERHLTIQP